MTTRTPLMAGNWKMNLDYKQGQALIEELGHKLSGHDASAVEVAVIPPFVDLRSAQLVIDADKLPFALGAQDLSEHVGSGAYTGEISGEMLTALDVTYVLIGHSERREYHHETEQVTNAKVGAAIEAGLRPMLCVGEPLEERKAGKQVEYTLAQVEGALEGYGADQLDGLVVAYEPVWAIGTGEVATPDDAQEVCKEIRDWLRLTYGDAFADRTRVLYGGSVKPGNAAELMQKDDVDGALVGGASLKADDFAGIVNFGK